MRKKFINFTVINLILCELITVVHAAYYCIESLAGGQCAPPLTYYLSVRLCCGTSATGTPGERLFETIPALGEKGSVPENCNPAPATLGGLSPCAPPFSYYEDYHLCCEGRPRFNADVLPSDGTDSERSNSDRGGGDARGPRIMSIDPPFTPLGTASGGAVPPAGVYCTVGPMVNGVMVCEPTHPYNAQYARCCGATPINTGANANANHAGGCVDRVIASRPLDCVNKAYLCNNPMYYDLMTVECPVTCKRCGGSQARPDTTYTGTAYTSVQYADVIGATVPVGSAVSGGGCVDRSLPGKPSDCPANAILCNHPAYFALMTVQCPATCGRCGGAANSYQNSYLLNNNNNNFNNNFNNNNNNNFNPATNNKNSLVNNNQFGGSTPGCVDSRNAQGGSDCPLMEARCRVPVWRNLMTAECPYTCDRNGCRSGRRPAAAANGGVGALPTSTGGANALGLEPGSLPEGLLLPGGQTVEPRGNGQTLSAAQGLHTSSGAQQNGRRQNIQNDSEYITP